VSRIHFTTGRTSNTLSSSEKENTMSLKTMRTDHVGGLLRPREVISALIARGKDEIDDDEIARVQEETIRDFVAKQEAMDLGMVSDGE
tara:strand:- start:434 stop:697 length:264 start_codon:yes stop_codon:yes gene_type:complete